MATATNFEERFASVMTAVKTRQEDAAMREMLPFEVPKAPNEIYESTPLNTEANEIRLLTLHSGTFADDIRCSLTKVSLDVEIDYEALSYTWGDAEKFEPIFVDNKVFSATVNLEAALRNLQQTIEPRRPWVDAVCINQQDVLEKNQQVSRMREIYHAARRVCVWLGDDEPLNGLAWISLKASRSTWTMFKSLWTLKARRRQYTVTASKSSKAKYRSEKGCSTHTKGCIWLIHGSKNFHGGLGYG